MTKVMGFFGPVGQGRVGGNDGDGRRNGAQNSSAIDHMVFPVARLADLRPICRPFVAVRSSHYPAHLEVYCMDRSYLEIR